MQAEYLWYALSAVLVLVGLAGTLVPALPGLPLILGGLVLAAWADGFTHVGAPTIAILALLTAAGMLIDFVAGLLGAKKTGASREALAGAFIGSLVGLFFGIAGVILGPVIGAVAGELAARRTLPQAGRVGIGTFLGFLAGTVAKLGCAFAMLAAFALALLL
ncbi:DUF456 domain-containing protein [Paludibacterium paludis]|uniref:Membrane protein n=1 Tax=Paludibacterium paludis TaxID=1225769 RepID=A0A918U7A2_9NEIS|nr:DUF456 family protein [Paludibacterium paludis]GGY02408.1 membrane protein [Paludibacterium paludis]